MTRQIFDAAEEHFQMCMELWQKLMRGDFSPAGYSGLDSVCGQASTNFMAATDDSEIVYEKNDKQLAEKVNACVESLAGRERVAVNIRYGLAKSSAWTFIEDRLTCLDAGMTRLRNLVSKRC